MDEHALPAERFEADRAHLRAVAYRMLGSLSEAEDAVQDAWLRVSRADASDVENITGWLTTIVARVCLNVLRARKSRPEESYEADAVPDVAAGPQERVDPEQEAVLAESVGLALLVVLDTLAPDERLAFVLHDMFAVPFDQIGLLIERTPAAARQLASRARRRVKGSSPAPAADLARRRPVVDAFLTAIRGGDFETLVTLLHPDVVLNADRWVIPTPEPVVLDGGHTVAKAAMAAIGRAQFTGVALVDGQVGLAMAPYGRLVIVLCFTIVDGGITEIDVIADPDRIAGIEIAALDD
ncbi:sigma-70 family RNA polymerase sigma factor [Streptomyces sp. CBMA152]|uniref:sigma-70 family RNA polymerase sigma factor n=1 Tax=Streptomyces sp. CBMA152 TaxID=1896312 RepID=UPI001660F2B2|nr:sigma-70 family RNA polymerase sigma factor [Streptomyces sp. CBMA152]MBD0746365.1 RNA polymerase subunit sigma-70 [Streptomyces sp. CBMA152]